MSAWASTFSLLLLLPGLGAAGASAAESPSPAEEDSGFADRLLRGAARVFTRDGGSVGRVYFPVVASNPNDGTTYGFLPAWLLTDERREIRHILAPMVTYNKDLGPGFSGTYYYYPTDKARLRVLLEKTEKSDYRTALRYEDQGLGDGRFVFRFETDFQADGSRQFYGVGPASAKGGQASERLLERLVQAEFGVRLFDSTLLAAGWKARRAEARPGVFSAPQALAPQVQGAAVYSLPELRLSRDTRDLPFTPSRGSLAEAFVEFSDPAWGSGSKYRHYGGQWRVYVPVSRNLVTVVHAQTEWSDGGEIPFTALASLGGARSLRGFTEGRFQDRGSLFANVEERWRFHSLNAAGAFTEFQVAPFLDAGTVAPSPGRVQARYVDAVAGIALRAVVRPTVVGKRRQRGPGGFRRYRLSVLTGPQIKARGH